MGVQRVVKDSPLYTIASAQNLLAPTNVISNRANTVSYYSTANGCPLGKDLIDQLESFADALSQQVNLLAAQTGVTDSVGLLYKKAYASFLQKNPLIVEPATRFYDAMFDLER